MFRLVYRTAYVILIGFLGVCLPFFGDIIGLVGAIGERGETHGCWAGQQYGWVRAALGRAMPVAQV